MAESSRTRASLPPNQDPTSVYFIHPSDANTTQLVSVKFNGSGFNNWKRSMILTLSANNKIGFVDGTIPKPVATSVEFKAWERCNDLVYSWLLFNLDDVIAKSVLFLKTAREIWMDLEERFGFTSMTQVYSLEQQLSEIHQGTDNVSEFFTKIKTPWDAISNNQDQRMLQFMMKLSEDFAAIRGNLLMQHPMPNKRNVSYYKGQSGSGSGSAKFQNNSANFHNNVGNKTSGNFSGNAGKKVQYYCTHCKMSGHNIERCFKVHGYPQGFKFKDKRVAAVTQMSNSESTEGSESFTKA
ncbi:uncharacterized protein LOC141713905 [Apium graveolens]|uniref:uncharacterized protein LOC141713905 n=1 Tax=Apium graveolens TaxID=4045 RepID=UPI003D7BB273